MIRCMGFRQMAWWLLLALPLVHTQQTIPGSLVFYDGGLLSQPQDVRSAEGHLELAFTIDAFRKVSTTFFKKSYKTICLYIEKKKLDEHFRVVSRGWTGVAIINSTRYSSPVGCLKIHGNIFACSSPIIMYSYLITNQVKFLFFLGIYRRGTSTTRRERTTLMAWLVSLAPLSGSNLGIPSPLMC